MANYAYTTLGITQTALVDAVDDSKFGQIQALLFTIIPSNLEPATLEKCLISSVYAANKTRAPKPAELIA